MVDFQYMIIGAGMMGAAAARHLSLGADSVAIIGPAEPDDVKNHRGVFSSHYDQARITRGLDGDPIWARLAKASIARYRDLEAQSGISFFNEVGCLFFGEPSPLCQGYLQAAQTIGAELGFGLSPYTDAALTADFPMFDFDKGMIGLHERLGAGHINPRQLVSAQLAAAQQQGVSLIRQTATSITPEGDHVRVSSDHGESWTAQNVLIAAGGFTNMNGLLPKPLDIRPTQKTIVFFELDEAQQALFEGMPSAVLLAPTEDDIVYILPPVLYPDGKIYVKIGGESEKTLVTSLEAAAKWFVSDGDQHEVQALTKIALRLMPGLRGAPVTSGSCVATMTGSGYPYIGFTDNPNVAVLTGGNFVSAKSSDELGRLGANLLAEGTIDADYGPVFTPKFCRN